MANDLTLPVARLPGIDAVAREVMGLDPWLWQQGKTQHQPALAEAWWRIEPRAERGPVIPLATPAGRLVAETWLGHRPPWVFGCTDLHAACLYLGDLLTLCSALGVEVPAGTVPRLEADDLGLWVLSVGGRELMISNTNTSDPRVALDAIVKEVCGG